MESIGSLNPLKPSVRCRFDSGCLDLSELLAIFRTPSKRPTSRKLIKEPSQGLVGIGGNDAPSGIGRENQPVIHHTAVKGCAPFILFGLWAVSAYPLTA